MGWGLPFRRKNILILKNSTGFPSLYDLRGVPVEFLRFHGYNLQLNSSDYYRDEPNPEYEP